MSEKLELRKRKTTKDKLKQKVAAKAAEPEERDDSSSDDEDDGPSRGGGGGRRGKKGGIKWKYVAFLCLLFGSAILPAVLWIVDHVGAASGGAFSGLSAKFGSFAPRPRPVF